jgi:hypothetical protein
VVQEWPVGRIDSTRCLTALHTAAFLATRASKTGTHFLNGQEAPEGTTMATAFAAAAATAFAAGTGTAVADVGVGGGGGGAAGSVIT